MSHSIGQALQNWLLRNEISVLDSMFVSAVDLAFENERRRPALHEDQSSVMRRAMSSKLAVASGDDGLATVSAAS